jgi:hypothetical protein
MRFDVLAKEKANSIRETLLAAMLQSPPPTLQEVAKKSKMSSSSALRARESDLCGRLLSLRKVWRRANEGKIEQVLLEALRNRELIPFQKFCKAKGISVRIVKTQFPTLKTTYDERYRVLKAARRADRMRKFDANVRDAVLVLRGRNEYPSVGRVVTENPGLRAGGWYRLQDAIRSHTHNSEPYNRSALDGNPDFK